MAEGRQHSRQHTRRRQQEVRAWFTAIGAIAVPGIALAELILSLLHH